MNDHAILEVKELEKDFGGIRATDHVSFSCKKGEIVGIIGPNGAGKTTIVNLISGFVRPSGGKIFFKGRDITGLAPHKIARLGIVRTFQKVKPLTDLPAFKNLVLPLTSPRLRHLSGGKYGNRDVLALDLMEEVGFERDSPMVGRLASELAHGYQKRLEIARCLALRPELIMFDEVLAGLTIAETGSFIPLLEGLKIQGITLFLIEHRLSELFRIADRIIVFNFGRKVSEGVPSKILEDPKVKEVYLGKILEEESIGE